ncbi:MAG: nucleoside-diphosphate kinase [Veillonella sp.]|uniref:nucleoside-diphosphate kinase n=1 Tax=Veillonella sp. TaxID=1926307 RepID=UPI0025FBE22F|nr:nucleoside-diphosphate kinase [Veillonella sp.]MBS4912770.1 nucleoside-diphosphate kinase [Veillonella sp.]
MEHSLVLIKPDGVAKKICGEIISRYERKGLTISAMKLINVSRDLAAAHYAEHKDKPFFEDLIAFITSGPVVAMVLSGTNAVAAIRQLNGATDPLKAEVGSIRGDFGLAINENVVHASDAVSTAEREVALWFPEFKN